MIKFPLTLISIVIPAYNEEKRLPSTLVKLREYLAQAPFDSSEILVVNDGSRDATATVACAAGVRVLENPGNRGKGFSVKHGMLEARGEWVLYTDADLSAPIGELERLWEAAQREGAQLAIGSRALKPSMVGVHQPRMRELAGRAFNLIMRMVTRLPFSRHAMRVQAIYGERREGDFFATAARRLRLRCRGPLYCPTTRL